MAKKRASYVCQSCGAVAPKWAGRCAECGEWNTLVEEAPVDVKKPGGSRGLSVEVTPIRAVTGVDESRFSTGLGEFDQVLGGGAVVGSVVLIGGEPGIGKSTVMLQIAATLEGQKKNILYVSAEESPTQLKMRAERVADAASDIGLLATNSFEEVEAALAMDTYDACIIDSIQTVASADIDSAGGTVSQVRHVTYRLVEIAKQRGVTVFIIGQVTKEGSIAGPKVLEHLVDTVLYFEGDYARGIRILRAVKNRFGSTNEVGLFEMTAGGLVELPAGALTEAGDMASGKAFSAVMEGTRAFMVELQALVSPTFYQYPRRVAAGFDVNRMHMLLAILEKRGGLSLSGADVYLNVAGGLKVTETSADLAVCAVLASSFTDTALPAQSVFLGEVGLTGQVRPVSAMQARVAELSRYGVTTAFVPRGSDISAKIKVVEIATVSELLDQLR